MSGLLSSQIHTSLPHILLAKASHRDSLASRMEGDRSHLLSEGVASHITRGIDISGKIPCGPLL